MKFLKDKTNNIFYLFPAQMATLNYEGSQKKNPLRAARPGDADGSHELPSPSWPRFWS